MRSNGDAKTRPVTVNVILGNFEAARCALVTEGRARERLSHKLSSEIAKDLMLSSVRVCNFTMCRNWRASLFRKRVEDCQSRYSIFQ